MVFEAHKSNPAKPCCGVDVVRCRMNGLANNRHEFPIFGLFDNVSRAVEGELADFSYVDLGTCQLSELSRIPYVGPAWYPRGSVEHLLEVGVIKWRHITWSLQATAHVSSSTLARALQIMKQAWGDTSLAKLSVNSMIGLFARDVSQTFNVRSSTREIDGGGHDFRQLFHNGDDAHIWDYIFCTRVVQNASYRPIHEYIMSFEHVMVAKVARFLMNVRVDRRYLSQIKTTDCILLSSLPKNTLENACR